MSRRPHNKKRNTGLLYEFLVRTISNSLVEGDQKTSSSALKIIKKFFKPGSQLYREFRLINSLLKTTVTTSQVAASILNEAKLAAKNYNLQQLDREKSLLIRTINHTLKEGFYDHHVDEYKIYATIQTLLNEWRLNDLDSITQRAVYEDQLMNWLMTEKQKVEEQVLSSETPGMNRLMMNIMMEKLNEKYHDSLTPEQKDVIRTYVWSTTSDDSKKIQNKLNDVRSSLLESSQKYSDENKENKYIVERIDQMKQKLLSENIEIVDDDTVTRFMLYMKLNDELLGEKNDK